MSKNTRLQALGAFVLGALLVASVAVAAPAAGFGGPALDERGTLQQGVAPLGPTVHVSATGQASAQPDQALVRLAVSVTDEDANAARTRVAEDVSRMKAALDDIGIAEDQIRTTGYSIYQTHDRPYDYGSTDGDEKQPRYVVSHSFVVELTDLDSVGEVVDTAVENGATDVYGVEFTLSEETRRELRAEALRDAMGNAREQADVLAGESNLRITGVHAVSTTDVAYPRYDVKMVASEAGAATTIDGGPLTIVTSVEVTYDARTQK
jgi:uncharacterized protein YggE